MCAARLWLTAVATLAAGGASADEPTALPPPQGAGIERGVAMLRCEAPSGLQSTSRATVLEVGAGAHADVLLATAHGLPAAAEDVRRACRVLVGGKEHSIDAVWRSGNHALGPEQDWAVLTAQRIKGELKRWRAVEPADGWLEQLVAAHAPVRLVLRYAGAEQSDCRLEAWTAHRLLAHTCVTYPGTSGTPLVVGVEREPVMIGLHVGSQLAWDGRKLSMVSVALPLDAAVIDAIEAAATHAAQPAAKRRR